MTAIDLRLAAALLRAAPTGCPAHRHDGERGARLEGTLLVGQAGPCPG
jgi:hypothetical protein